MQTHLVPDEAPHCSLVILWRLQGVVLSTCTVKAYAAADQWHNRKTHEQSTKNDFLIGMTQ